MANGNFGGGNGTFDNPYIIEDGLDFVAIPANSYCILKNDIDLTGLSIASKVGIKLNGNNMTVSNLSSSFTSGNCSIYDVTFANSQTSLITSTTTLSVIHDINFIDCTSSQPLLCSNAILSSISSIRAYNCVVNGSAGLAPSVGSTSVSISNCSFEGTVNSTNPSSATGGLITSSTNRFTLRSCFFRGTLNSANNTSDNTSGVGGLVGFIGSNSYTANPLLITDCFVDATINAPQSNFTGGITGSFIYSPNSNSYGGDAIFQNCYFKGSLSGISRIGGIVGSTNINNTNQLAGNKPVIRNCFAYIDNVILTRNATYSLGDICNYPGLNVESCFSYQPIPVQEVI